MVGDTEILGAKVTFFLGGGRPSCGRVYYVKLKPIMTRHSDGSLVARFKRGEVEYQPDGNKGMNAAQMELRIIETELIARLVDKMVGGEGVAVELENG